MATRLKTVEYSFPTQLNGTNNAENALTGITIYLPEATKTFRSVVLTWGQSESSTASTSYSRRQVTFGLGAAATTVINNANAIATSGENMFLIHTVDLTSYFAANWSGTSMAASCSLLSNNVGTGATAHFNSVTISITYEYDDVAATHLKTVYIPMDSPASAVPTASTLIDTIPALDTFCPEAGKVFRDAFLVVEGNSAIATGTVDTSLTPSIGGVAQAAHTFEGSQTSDLYFRSVWKAASPSTGAPTFSTAAAQNLETTSTLARLNHVMFTLVVTYEFDPAATTTVLNSLQLPMEIQSPQASSLATAGQADRELWVQEGSPVLQRSSFRLHFEHNQTISGFNLAIGTQTYRAYTLAATQVCGGNAVQRTFTASDLTLARGRNKLLARTYCTNSGAAATGLCGMWIVNYTSAKAAQGVGAHNHSVRQTVWAVDTQASGFTKSSAAVGVSLPETNEFRSAIGLYYGYMTSGTANPSGMALTVEILPSETGGVSLYASAYSDASRSDPESGWRTVYGTLRDIFRRWKGDPDTSRVSLSSPRVWRVFESNATAVFDHLELMVTYHAITYTVSGTVSGYTGDGSGLTVNLHRAGSGEKVMTMTTTAGGAFTGVWYDNTEQVYVEVFQDATHVGRSASQLAA